MMYNGLPFIIFKRYLWEKGEEDISETALHLLNPASILKRLGGVLRKIVFILKHTHLYCLSIVLSLQVLRNLLIVFHSTRAISALPF